MEGGGFTLIIIDAGHGGKDPGASYNGIQEKDWTLEVSLYQYTRCQDIGIPVLLTRSSDSTLSPDKRSNIVKTSNADICISNHYNAGGGIGCEVIHSIYDKSKFANEVASQIKSAGMPVRRVFSRKGSKGDYYYMHRLTGKVKTVIVEYGFLDNQEDFLRLYEENKRFTYAEAVIKALCNWLNHPYKANKINDKNESTNGPPFYFVQVGAFKHKENAVRLASQLKKDGYPAIIK
jgi:N-acetylmuramoyl-L-alanine amidase